MPNTTSDGPATGVMNSAELHKHVPFSPSYIWRLERIGAFPKRIKLGLRRVGWDRAEVLDWIESKKSERHS